MPMNRRAGTGLAAMIASRCEDQSGGVFPCFLLATFLSADRLAGLDKIGRMERAPAKSLCYLADRNAER